MVQDGGRRRRRRAACKQGLCCGQVLNWGKEQVII